MNGKTLLLVEDSKEVQNYNKEMLEDEGFAIAAAMTLSEARKNLAGHGPAGGGRPDAIILDIGMPDGNGLDFLRELREQGNKIPVLLLTGYGEEKDVEKGFDSGCDDYLPKPYTFKILLMRIKRLLERTEQIPETVTRGRLTLKPAPMIALIDGKDILLTQKEFALLMLFVQNEGETMSSEYLYEKVWNQEMIGEARAVKQQISNLREKIEESGYVITTIRGAGYCFEQEL